MSIYEKPIDLGRLNVQPITGQSTSAFGNVIFKDYGDKVERMQVVFLDYDKWYGWFKEDDKAYIDTEIETENEISSQTCFYGDKANYRVVSVRPQNVRIAVYFEKLPDKED